MPAVVRDGLTADRVDEIVRLWTEARPDLDSKPMAPIGRILRLARHFDRELAPVYRARDSTSGSSTFSRRFGGSGLLTA